MLKPRMTYVPVEIASRLDDFIISRSGEALDAVMARTHDYNTLSVLKLLYVLHGSPATFSELYAGSKIRMKKSFMRYLRFCINYGFVEKSGTYLDTVYTITARGSVMLGLFLGEDSRLVAPYDPRLEV